jgi:RNase II-type exonuclease C-terminal S1 domain
VVLDEPAVRARCDGTALQVGERVSVVLVEADVARREVRFRLG